MTIPLNAAEVAFLNNFEEIASSGSLVCVMGAVSHYSINHKTGQMSSLNMHVVGCILGCLLGGCVMFCLEKSTLDLYNKKKKLALKVANVLNLEYPEERPSQLMKNILSPHRCFIYAVAHPVSKCSMLYILRFDIPNLTAAWLRGP